MTVIHPNSISGITSVTSHSNSLYFYESDHSTKLTINAHVNGDVTAANGNFSGNLNVGGVLTYEDVTSIDSVGIITAQSDISIADKIIHTGDTDTALRFPAADTFTLETAGSERLRIDSNGYVDIQTGILGDNPSDNFTLNGRTQPHYGFNLVPETGVPIGIAGYRGIAFASSGTERMRISEGGSVGIGTDNPQEKLHIQGDVRLVDNSPRIGFHDANAANNLSCTGGIELFDKDGNRGAYMGATEGANFLSFGISPSAGAAPTEKLRITSAGLLGVGTINPTLTGTAAGMHIAGGNAALKLQNTNNGDWAFIEYADESNTTKYIQGYRDSSGVYAIRPGTSLNATPGITLDSNGKVGINEINPDRQLSVYDASNSGVEIKSGTTGQSSIFFTDTADGNIGMIGYYHSDDSMFLRTNNDTRVTIDSSGRILKGIVSSILGGDDIQLLGSGGPATVGGYWSNNNPAADSKMLSIRGYSQSGSTFTSLAEIDFRTDQNTATSSGSHDGSIVMRVNGGSQSGTWANYPYSFAGIKDRERLTRRSKRFYCLPEYSSGSTSYNAFREEWDYQHMVGYNTYSWYRFTTHSGNHSRGGSVDIKITWSTRHASGSGYGHYGFHWRDNHSNARVEIGNVYKYHQHHLNGSYYGWNGSPQLDVYETTSTGNVGGFYLRVQGYMAANSSTYDGGVMHQFTINAHTNRLEGDVNKFEFVGNSTPSDVGSIQGNNNLP